MAARKDTTNTLFRANLQSLLDRLRARRGGVGTTEVRPPTSRLTRRTKKVTPDKGGRGGLAETGRDIPRVKPKPKTKKQV